MDVAEPRPAGQHPGEVEQGRDGGLRENDSLLGDGAVDGLLAGLDVDDAYDEESNS
jgi:hypothetical protein